MLTTRRYIPLVLGLPLLWGCRDNPNEPDPPSLVADYVQISAGVAHSCAVTADRDLLCWGSGGSGRLGIGNTLNQTTPILVTGGFSWLQVSAGAEHTCGVTTDNELYCWGNGGSGRLGNGSTENTAQPRIASRGLDWAQVSAGKEHTCGVTTAGELYCWGEGSLGRLGTALAPVSPSWPPDSP